MENGTPQLVARDLRRSFRMGPRRIEVLRSISMEVRRSEAVFLVGASGAGKTTLLYTLAGLERPEEGTVDFEGQRLYTGSSQAQAQIRNTQMGFVFQSYFLLPELTALENVMLPGMIGGSVRESAAEESLRAVGLGERLQHLPAELSGGEQQRVAIARALINNPGDFRRRADWQSRLRDRRQHHGAAAESRARRAQDARGGDTRPGAGAARRPPS